MIDTILDACRAVLESNGDPQTPFWLASHMVEMRMWRASEHDVRTALEQDMKDKDTKMSSLKATHVPWYKK